MKNIFRVFLKCYDFYILDKITSKLKVLSCNFKINISGPVYLPTKKEIFNILRSPHVNKDSRDQFGLFTHKRIFDFFNVDINFILILRNIFFFYSFDFNFKFLKI